MITILQGDALEQLYTLPDESVQCCCTSPPYWGLRDYGVAGQIGLETTLEEFIEKLVAVFAQVRRVLKKDGTCWVNMGDCYISNPAADFGDPKYPKGRDRIANQPSRARHGGLKPKDLVGQPWMLAFALRADGWYLRSDIIWHKPNPMPESVTDRPTKAHEYLFLLTKSLRYYYDAEAIKEPVTGNAHPRGDGVNPKSRGYKTPGKNSRVNVSHCGAAPQSRQNESYSAAVVGLVDTRNKRDVWTVATEPYAEAHFATFPPSLIRPCILAGSRPGDMVLDPFGGSGTTGAVSLELGRRATLIELNPDYIPLIEKRCAITLGLPLGGRHD